MDPKEGSDKVAVTSFLDLPPELRNRMYDLNLSLSLNLNLKPVEPLRQHTHSDIQSPSLLKVSRQIRSETVPIYYGSNFFQVRDFSMLLSWLQLLDSAERSTVRGVYVASKFARSMEHARKIVAGMEEELRMKHGLVVSNGSLYVWIMERMGDRKFYLTNGVEKVEVH